MSAKGEFLQPLLDLGLDISEFHNFKASFKSEFIPEHFFTLHSEELAFKSSSINFINFQFHIIMGVIINN